MSIPEPQPEQARRRRRWFQFSLRGVLLFVTLVAAALGLAMWRVNEVRSQREAVREIEHSGGTLLYFRPIRTEDDLSFMFGFEPLGPAWARLFVGDFYFAEEVKLTYGMLWQPKPVDVRNFDLARHLAKLPHLASIDLSDTNAGDDMVQELRQLFPNTKIER